MTAKLSPEFRLFVSHVHEETKLAEVVKHDLEDAFAERLTVFVSSLARDNPGGEEWEGKIREELRNPQLRMLIALVSPLSVREPWISVEMGAAWIQGTRVFPLCHSGQPVITLPRPMQGFGGAELSADDSAKRLIAAAENATGLQVPRRWPVNEFLARLRAAANDVPPAPSLVRATGTVTPEVPPPPDQVKILRALAVVKNQGFDDVSEYDAHRLSELEPAVFMWHAKTLLGRMFIFESHYGEGAHYSLAPDGAGWLIRNNQMPSED